jgi:DHA1 family multidrug resistance protein-like MFS transporter
MARRVLSGLIRRAPASAPRPLVALLCAQTILLWLGAGAIVPLMPTYLRHHGATTALVGVVMGSYYAASVLTQYPAGRLSDRIGRRPVLAGGLGLFAAGSIGFALTAGPQAAIAFRALQGCGAGAVTVASAAMIGAELEEGSRGGAFGALYGSQTLALAIGPLVGSLAGISHMGILFMVAAAMAAVASLPVVLGAKREIRSGRTSGDGATVAPSAAVAVPAGERWSLSTGPAEAMSPAQPPPRRGMRCNPAVIGVVVAFASSGLLIGTYETSWTLLLQYRGASDLEVGLSWTLFALPFALLSVPAGRLAERADRRLLTVVSIAVSAAFAIVYAVLVSPALLVGLAALEAIGTVAATPAAVTVLSEAVPADAQGEAQGTAETARTAAAALAALVSGALFGIGPAVPFVACALVLVVGCGVITLSWRNGWSHPSTRLAARPQAERSLR